MNSALQPDLGSKPSGTLHPFPLSSPCQLPACLSPVGSLQLGPLVFAFLVQLMAQDSFCTYGTNGSLISAINMGISSAL